MQYFYNLEILSSQLNNLLFIFVLPYAILMLSLFTSQFFLFSQLHLKQQNLIGLKILLSQKIIKYYTFYLSND